MPTAPGFAHVGLEMTHALMTRKAMITFGIDPVVTDPAIVATGIRNSYISAGSLLTGLDSNVTITTIRLSMGTDGSEDLVYELPTSDVGTAGLVSLPANSAVLVHKVTARGGRRGRGRLFVPWFIDEGIVDEAGIIQSATVTALQTKMTAWLASLATNDCPMFLFHKESEPWDPIKETGVEHPTTPGPPTAVTALRVDRLIGSQRRRLGR